MQYTLLGKEELDKARKYNVRKAHLCVGAYSAWLENGRDAGMCIQRFFLS